MRNVSTETASLSLTVGRVPTFVTPAKFRPSASVTREIYTPRPGTSTCPGTVRFTVGIPIVRPKRKPCPTVWLRQCGWPRNSAARSMSPACTSERM